MSKSTMIELVEELQKLPQSAELDLMIKEAKAGEYHDYKNEKYICGKIESSQRLRKLGHSELAKRIEQAEFDESADEEDNKKMREEALKGGISPEMLKIFGLTNPNTEIL